MDRVFLDANVLVSAALKPDSRIATLWDAAHVRLLASPYVVAEARRNVPEPEVAARLEALLEGVAVLPNEPAGSLVAPDPCLPEKDRPVLLGAIAAGASYLLTGDMSHFGPCFGNTYQGVTVLLPGDYLRKEGRP
jgi:uncharacterized protein